MNEGLLRSAWLTGLGATVAGPQLLWLATAPPEPMWSRLAVVSGFFALTVLVCAAVLSTLVFPMLGLKLRGAVPGTVVEEPETVAVPA